MTTRAILLALALPLAAQQPRFDSNSRLVLIPATVTDSRYRPVDSLESADFLVSDNGLPRPVTVDTIGTGVAPIALIVAVQSSGISAAVLEKSRAIAAMIQPLVAGERGCAGVLSFDQRISLLQPCTNNPDAFARAFLSIQPLTRPGEDKQARLIDAVQSSVEHLVKLPNSRRVLLLISETRDRGSESSLDSAVIAAQTAGVTVYAATYSAFKTAFTSKAPVSQPRRAIKPKTPNDETGTVNAAPPGKNNPWPKIPPPERQID
ncbi:MAG: von Willebrand factor, type, partial [Candidatus Solibacter sp.]|nr:von Willebrand factor, type [Candidatus Solibacter sp.]